jgi:PAX-interacting protein 1
MRRRTTKESLPMFFVELKAANNKNIYNINFLLQYKIKYEPPVRREIPQCSRCQRYGHIKNFCFRQERCIKCAEEHVTIKCPRETRSQDAKYILCNGNHPAN